MMILGPPIVVSHFFARYDLLDGKEGERYLALQLDAAGIGVAGFGMVNQSPKTSVIDGGIDKFVYSLIFPKLEDIAPVFGWILIVDHFTF